MALAISVRTVDGLPSELTAEIDFLRTDTDTRLNTACQPLSHPGDQACQRQADSWRDSAEPRFAASDLSTHTTRRKSQSQHLPDGFAKLVLLPVRREWNSPSAIENREPMRSQNRPQ